ncbi:MAG: hypothetical protein Q4D62_14600 [Planctomycetia bacterium]|nr:hypothetical protein [Planctomycetia bacterium]
MAESESVSVESLAAKVSAPPKWVSSRHFPRLVKEMILGLALGILVLAGLSFFRTPVEERLRESLRGEHFSEVIYQPSEKSLLPGEFCWRDVEWRPAEGEMPGRTILADSLTAKIQPISWVDGSLRVEKLAMRGIRFPLLQTVAGDNSPTVALGGVLENQERKLDEKMASLQSLAWIEGVKGRYLPEFEKMSTRLAILEKDASEIRVVMEQALQQGNEPNQETSLMLERLAEIRQESDELQKKWKETSSEVTQALSQMGKKIAVDGKDLAKILRGDGLARTSLETFLYTPETSRQLYPVLAAGGALETLVLTALLPNDVPPESLETSGEIELCGGIFQFSGDWNTRTREDCLRSFYGTMELREKNENDENPVAGSLMLSCRQKKNLTQRHLTLRIPLGKEEITLGNPSEPLALRGISHDGTLEMECDLFDNEIQGTLRITRRGVAWQCAESAPATFQEAIGRSLDDSLTWEVALSGTLEEPVFHYTKTAVETLLPIYAQAIQESTQQKRSELVKQIYGKLKNAETMFNSAMEPHYQKMSASTENIMKIHERLAARVTAPAVVAPVTIAEIRLDTSEEAIEEEIPMFDPTLGTLEEPAQAVGTQVEVAESQEKTPVSEPSSQTRFVPVKKVAVITPPVEETVPALPATQEKKNASVEITPMEATFFANSTPHAVETPLVTAEMTAPHGPLPLAIGENAPPPAPKNAVPATPAAKSNMPVPVMRSSTHFGG